jgi:hypothetical protein
LRSVTVIAILPPRLYLGRRQANSRCEVVICLLSKHWEASPECKTEFRYAETLNKTIVVARLESVPFRGDAAVGRSSRRSRAADRLAETRTCPPPTDRG